MKRQDAYAAQRASIERERPPQAGPAHDGGPWRGPSTDEWIERIKAGAGLGVPPEPPYPGSHPTPPHA